MSNRARLSHVVQDSDGDVQAGVAAVLYQKDGSTPLSQSVYAAESGGAPLTSLATNSLGLLEVYAPLGERVKITFTGVTPQATSSFDPDPADVIVQNITVPVVFDSYDSDDEYALTVKPLGSLAKGVRFQDDAGNDLFRVRKSAGGNPLISMNVLDSTLPETAFVHIAKASAVNGFSAVRIALNVTAAALSAQAMDVTVSQSVNGSSNIHAGSFTAIRTSPADAAVTAGVLSTVFSQVGGAGPGYNVGFLARSGPYTSGVRNGAAFYADGADGWTHGFYYAGTDGVTQLASIDQNGLIASRGLVPIAADAVSLGSPSLRFVVVYSNFLSATSNGTGAAPSILFQNDTDNGFFLAATDAVGFSTNGTEAFRITAAGLLDWRRGQNVGVGGGAAATLSTIGGSGPASAGQAGWLKQSIAGTAIFTPYWV